MEDAASFQVFERLHGIDAICWKLRRAFRFCQRQSEPFRELLRIVVELRAAARISKFDIKHYHRLARLDALCNFIEVRIQSPLSGVSAEMFNIPIQDDADCSLRYVQHESNLFVCMAELPEAKNLSVSFATRDI